MTTAMCAIGCAWAREPTDRRVFALYQDAWLAFEEALARRAIGTPRIQLRLTSAIAARAPTFKIGKRLAIQAISSSWA